jgi:UDP-N-acetylglucosamine 4,6-dehydratase
MYRRICGVITYTIGEMAKKLGKSTKTLQQWDRKGILVAHRTPTNRRYYSHEQFLEMSGRDKYKRTGSDLDAIRGKVVLITGGSGSLGNQLVDRICDYAKKVIVYSRCELKQANMRQRFHDKSNIRYFIGDIRDEDRLKTALSGVNICIHSGCMKRIDSCHYDPIEAVKSNVVGTMNVINACRYNNLEKALMVSTDKACNTATLYGGTKFVSEQLFIYGNNYSDTNNVTFTCIRYGNIYGSNGSIKHIFDRQAKESGVLSITHEDMTRFFMSLDDSVDLVLYALNKCVGGEIFIPKMKAIKIMDLANILYPDLPKKIIGLGGHEEIHEELISEIEGRYVVCCDDKYYKIIPPMVNVPGVGWDINYPEEKIVKPFKYSSNNSDILTNEEIIKFNNSFNHANNY